MSGGAQTALVIIVGGLVLAAGVLAWCLVRINADAPPAPDATKKPDADESSLL